jgi:signal transduction histidine kinase
VLIDEALANRSAGPDELRSILEQLRSNSEETERLIDALLLLARSERGIDQWSRVDLSEAASSVVEQSHIEATAAGVTLSSDLEPVVVSGDPGLLERLAGNLVENAIRPNIPGGSVSVTTRRDVNTGVLEVTNTGPVLEGSAVAGLVEPFRRAGPDRSGDNGGLGLGLSIVNAIVSAHRGTMLLSARDGGGLQVRVQLPDTGPAAESVQAAGPGSVSGTESSS